MRSLSYVLSVAGLFALGGCAVTAAEPESESGVSDAHSALSRSATSGATTSGATTLTLAVSTKLKGAGTVSPPKDPTVVYFKCGYNPKTYRSECSCSGDVDCNNMFSSGFCADSATCDNGNNTCTCELAW